MNRTSERKERNKQNKDMEEGEGPTAAVAGGN